MTPRAKRWLAAGAVGAGLLVIAKAVQAGAFETIDDEGHRLRADAAKAFKAMKAAARAAGHVVEAGPGATALRTYADQALLYARYMANPCAGTPRNPTPISLPGCGNLASKPVLGGKLTSHEAGLSVDLAVTEGSAAYRWLAANAGRFGFVNDGLTFGQREPWHWSYRG